MGQDFWWKKQNKSKKPILSMLRVTVKLQNYLPQQLVRLVRVWLNLEGLKLQKKLQLLWPIQEMWCIYPKANRLYCPYPNNFSEKTFFCIHTCKTRFIVIAYEFLVQFKIYSYE